jgi:anti-sigma factor RsiW
MAEMVEPDDSTLVAYVDGELDAATAREVERMLESSPAARNTVARLRASASLVRAAFADAVHEPPPPGLIEMLHAAKPARAPRRFSLPLAASIALLLGLGLGAAGGVVGTRELAPRAAGEGEMARLVDDVAEYHRVYSREQRHMVEVAASETPHLEDWLGRRMKGQLTIPNLASQGLAFQGGRLLAFDGQPMAELIYKPADGPPVGLCIAFALPGMSGARTEQRGDLTVRHWVDNGYVYSVVGWTNDHTINAIADSVRAQLHL